ncbi:hypothetical protein PhCBS80983_g02666 [Powellomyces hirtus]|uniref:50S ribosomal protein L9, chloroplastic n=1 Tax=Powellomyces hirtus TaxID=109895 RepID=A0A507E5K5_9FUNG|nr:hypothetical protein PhCBS80983_g02666 [Powellomyces hirtus]
MSLPLPTHTLRAIRALRPQAVHLVSAQRTKFSKPDIHVFMRDNVPGIGEKGEITLVNLAQARNYLVPFGLAYYVPRIKGKPILPEGWEPRIREDDVVLETIVPAFSSVKIEQRQTLNETSVAAGTATREKRIELDSEKHSALLAIKNLTFDRVKMRADSTRIYGSVTPEDIVVELLDKYGVVLEKEAVQLGERIKDVGTHSVHVALDPLPPVELQIVVVDSGAN